MERIIECVPNFSEGRDIRTIEEIRKAIRGYGSCPSDGAGGRLEILHTDRGEAANRTVITFAGSPEAVAEAAFRAVKKAAEMIDMRLQHGTHPRSGATDVLPLVPVRGITLEECAELARKLAGRIFSELGIPCYCYEAAAFRPERKRLEICRSGEYEALPQKISDPDRRPDFSPDRWNDIVARSGAVNVGARNFLIAVNFNLDTDSAGMAMEIARDVRESGRIMTDPVSGKPVKGPDGKTARTAGPLKGCKAIGWYIEEYGIAQVSMNITDIESTPLHKAYIEVCRAARARGVNVTGTEIIGLVPEKSLLDAGEFFLNDTVQTQDMAETCTDDIDRKRILVNAAIRHMGLDSLRPFNPEDKVIEYRLDSRPAI